MPISIKKINEISAQMDALSIVESDLDEQFVRGSGKGGQKVNKTSSCVRLTHIPTNIQVTCQKERSRESNRWLARRCLCEKMLEKQGQGLSQREKRIAAIQKRKYKKSKNTNIGSVAK